MYCPYIIWAIHFQTPLAGIMKLCCHNQAKPPGKENSVPATAIYHITITNYHIKQDFNVISIHEWSDS